MTKIQKRQVNKSYEIYLSVYQAVTGTEEDRNIYKQFTRKFFDLIVIEQKRIVTKIDELMVRCDKMKKQIDMATEKQTALFDAVLAGV